MHIDFSDKYKIIGVIFTISLGGCAMVQKTSPTAAAKPCTAKNASDPNCLKAQLTSPGKQIRKNPALPKGKPPTAPTAPKTHKQDDDELPNRKDDPF